MKQIQHEGHEETQLKGPAEDDAVVLHADSGVVPIPTSVRLWAMNRRETERFLDALAEARAAGERVALATVIRVHGSAYRREGARMLVRPDGTYECALSGGCLEPAVAEAARA